MKFDVDPAEVAAGCAAAESFLRGLRASLSHGNELHDFLCQLDGDRLLGASAHIQKVLEAGLRRLP